jgi:predicted HTH transcriptional regulator
MTIGEYSKDAEQRSRISATITSTIHKKFLNEYENNLIKLIEENPGVTYIELVSLSIVSPETIWKTLVRLRKEKKLESFSINGKKAMGWRLTHDHSVI